MGQQSRSSVLGRRHDGWWEGLRPSQEGRVRRLGKHKYATI